MSQKNVVDVVQIGDHEPLDPEKCQAHVPFAVFEEFGQLGKIFVARFAQSVFVWQGLLSLDLLNDLSFSHLLDDVGFQILV